MDLFQQHQSAIRQAFARGLGGTVDAFAGDRLALVERPGGHWGYMACGVTFPNGTLVAVAPEILEFARRTAPELHRVAVGGEYFEGLRDESRRLGIGAKANVSGTSICWGLATAPPAANPPQGLRFECVDRDWLNDEIPAGRLANGAGPPDGGDGRAFRNLYGIAVRNSSDE